MFFTCPRDQRNNQNGHCHFCPYRRQGKGRDCRVLEDSWFWKSWCRPGRLFLFFEWKSEMMMSKSPKAFWVNLRFGRSKYVNASGRMLFHWHGLLSIFSFFNYSSFLCYFIWPNFPPCAPLHPIPLLLPQAIRMPLFMPLGYVNKFFGDSISCTALYIPLAIP